MIAFSAGESADWSAIEKVGKEEKWNLVRPAGGHNVFFPETESECPSNGGRFLGSHNLWGAGPVSAEENAGS